MKRWSTRILICLILGTVTTVAVAWACALWSDRGLTSAFEEENAFRFLARHVSIERTDGLSIQGEVVNRFGARRSFAVALVPAEVRQGPPRTVCVYVYEQGWPFPCLVGEHVFGDAIKKSGLRGAFLLPESVLGRQEMLALRPRFLYFGADIMIYGGSIALVWFGPAALRLLIRRHRGQCPVCGYDLRGHTGPYLRPLSQGERGVGCPECGWNRKSAETEPLKGEEAAT